MLSLQFHGIYSLSRQQFFCVVLRLMKWLIMLNKNGEFVKHKMSPSNVFVKHQIPQSSNIFRMHDYFMKGFLISWAFLCEGHGKGHLVENDVHWFSICRQLRKFKKEAQGHKVNNVVGSILTQGTWRKTNAKYESPMSNSSKIIVKVKSFALMCQIWELYVHWLKGFRQLKYFFSSPEQSSGWAFVILECPSSVVRRVSCVVRRPSSTILLLPLYSP